MDSRGPEAARPWIEAANPTYPCLVDERHLVADLYGMINVPNAVWIDEGGRIVRPAEPAGTSEAWRTMDQTSFSLEAEAIATISARRKAYLDAIRDWVEKGDQSPHVLSPSQIMERVRGHSQNEALAAANFQMGLYLHRLGDSDLARRYFETAKALHPENWGYLRQVLNLGDLLAAGGPEFWAAVESLGAGRYYPEIEIAGMPADPVP